MLDMGACGSKDPKTSGGTESAKRHETTYQTANGDGAQNHPDFGLKDTHDLKKFLGRGGTGDTYLFTDKRNNQPVAIKLIKRPIPKVILPNILREIRVRTVADTRSTVFAETMSARSLSYQPKGSTHRLLAIHTPAAATQCCCCRFKQN